MAWICKLQLFTGAQRSLMLPGLLISIALWSPLISGEDLTAQGIRQEAAGEAIEQRVEQAAEKAVEQAVEKAAEKAVEQAAEKAAEKAVEQAVEKAAEKAVEKTVEKAAGKAIEKAVEKSVEQAAQQAAAEDVKAEQTARRPDEWRGPTEVHFMVFVVDIDAIDDADQNFTTNVYLRLRWQDRRLANPGAAVRQLPLNSVWNPRVLLANQTGMVMKSLPEVVQVEDDGTVTYHQRYTGKLSQQLKLDHFPMDSHTFVIQFVAAGYRSGQLEFIPDEAPTDPPIVGGSIADELSLPDWKILSHEALKLTYQPIETVHSPGFGLRFKASRYFTYYLWQVVLPMGVVVIMAWSAFWIGRGDVGVRLGVANSAILTLIASRFVFASLLPRLPYMTRMDYLTVGSTLLVLLSLFLVVATAFLDKRKKTRLAERLDRWGRAGYPIAFLCLYGWFLFP
jgi:hypothetical protein